LTAFTPKPVDQG